MIGFVCGPNKYYTKNWDQFVCSVLFTAPYEFAYSPTVDLRIAINMLRVSLISV